MRNNDTNVFHSIYEMKSQNWPTNVASQYLTPKKRKKKKQNLISYGNEIVDILELSTFCEQFYTERMFHTQMYNVHILRALSKVK